MIPGLGLGGGIPEVVAPLEQGAAATMAAALMEAGGAPGAGEGWGSALGFGAWPRGGGDMWRVRP